MNTHKKTRQAYPGLRRMRTYACMTLLILLAQLLPYQHAHAVSTWAPTLLVNTESFQQIDRGDGSTTVDLQFGATTSTLKLLTNSTFQFNKSLSVVGTLSGSSLRVDQNADVFGALTVSGSIVSNSTVSGANLTFMGATNSYILGSLGIGTTTPNAKLEVVGTFSGSLITQNGTGSNYFLGNLGVGTTNPGRKLDVRTDVGTPQLQISTNVKTIGSSEETGKIAFAAFDNNVTAPRVTAAIRVLATEPHTAPNAGTEMRFQTTPNGTAIPADVMTLTQDGGVAIGTGSSKNAKLHVVGTISGSRLSISHNANITGSLLTVGGITSRSSVSGAYLTFMGATSSYILGSVGIGKTLPKAKLDVLGTISGSRLTISGNGSFTGSLVSKGGFSGATFFGSGLGDCSNTTTSKIVYNPSTGKFQCATDQGGGGGGISFTTASGSFVNKGGGTLTGTLNIQYGNAATAITQPILNVRGTASGKVIYGMNRLASSGVIVLRLPGATEPTLYANGTQKVGINTGSPHSSFTSSGTFATSVRIATATGAINGGDQVVFASGSSMITLTLPSALSIPGRQYTIKKTSTTSNTHIRPVIIVTTSNQTIDRLPSWRLVNRGQQITVISDGANWQVIDASSYGINGYRAMGSTMNQWYGSMATATAHTTAILTTTATIRTLPFVAEKVMTINGMSISVQTVGVSSEVRLALYRDSGRGYPDALIVDAGTVSTATSGHRTICNSGCTSVGSSAFPVTIQPGLYWLAINNNSIAVTLRGYALAQLIPVTGKPNGFTTTTNVGWNIANAYGAFPAAFPSTATANAAIPLPVLTVRIEE